MSLELTEEEMRRALFGSVATKSSSNTSHTGVNPRARLEMERTQTEPEVGVPRKLRPKPLSPKLRVILHVAKVFDGETEVFVHEANTLSTLLAEQEARKVALKRRFKYVELISIEPV